LACGVIPPPVLGILGAHRDFQPPDCPVHARFSSFVAGVTERLQVWLAGQALVRVVAQVA
jgi:hypothetical protein